MQKIGVISQEIIDLLKLNIAANTPIYIGVSNIEHMKNRHAYEYEKYFDNISDINADPDYVGITPKDNSIQYVKEYCVSSEYIRVAVRISQSGKCFARTLHLLSTYNAENYIKKGTLKKLDKK
mgnify:CR=1 FL=1